MSIPGALRHRRMPCGPRGFLSRKIENRLFRHRLERVTPPDKVRDPYFVAALIALAQEKYRTAQREGLDNDTSFSVRTSHSLPSESVLAN
jgi:hypothetical protein